ncbi:MAG: flavodoxin family protein [Treponema sp.]|jgi:multimeric flavodoxin WrbA|nr:flavodoxin family protein [Treponema sp.]
MKTIILWSSPNEHGLTAEAKNSIITGLKHKSNDIKVVPLNQMNIKNCFACGDGWGKCREQGACIIKDDFQQLYDDMIISEGIVIITPVYWHDMSENLKCFLDRLRRCETAHNRMLNGKICMLVACAGGTGLGAIQCLSHMEDILSHMQIKTVERLPVIQFNKSYMLPALIKAGETFADYLVTNGGQL